MSPTEVRLDPNYEVLCEWFARNLIEQGFDRFSREPVLALIDQVRYLALTDPDALDRVQARLKTR